MIAAVQLDQHTLPGHPLPAHPVLGWAPSPRTVQSGVHQDAPQGGPADDDALALGKQLAEMRVVGTFVLRTSQVDHIGHHGIGCGIGRSTAPVTMGEGSRASLLIGYQDAPGVARRADSHQFSRLSRAETASQVSSRLGVAARMASRTTQVRSQMSTVGTSRTSTSFPTDQSRLVLDQRYLN